MISYKRRELPSPSLLFSSKREYDLTGPPLSSGNTYPSPVPPAQAPPATSRCLYPVGGCPLFTQLSLRRGSDGLKWGLRDHCCHMLETPDTWSRRPRTLGPPARTYARSRPHKRQLSISVKGTSFHPAALPKPWSHLHLVSRSLPLPTPLQIHQLHLQSSPEPTHLLPSLLSPLGTGHHRAPGLGVCRS